jgi:hypothetical protein
MGPGDVGALLAGPEPRWRTLQVVGREWRRHGLLSEAFMAAAPRRGEVARGVRFAGGGIVVRASGEPEAEESEKSWRLWLASILGPPAGGPYVGC